MRLSVIHRLRHGHWYEPRFVPISDYFDWRVCGTCQDIRLRAEGQAILAAQARNRAEGRGDMNLTQIFHGGMFAPPSTDPLDDQPAA